MGYICRLLWVLAIGAWGFSVGRSVLFETIDHVSGQLDIVVCKFANLGLVHAHDLFLFRGAKMQAPGMKLRTNKMMQLRTKEYAIPVTPSQSW
ncbi:hypothetical protein PHISCL_10449 [Aspergillus sclerotialis]|uniref:Secreted protein n=1 Tax=Aspergillus sclerotialis TaxID=2070753 RepID=A0A3A2ZCY5_9EURO|nr:hypothetical protein PHISCL_10449 [Aspergillus sclerotialis]